MQLNFRRSLLKLVIFCGFLFLTTRSSGQLSDTIVKIEAVVVEGNKNSIDTDGCLLLSENLTQRSPAFIKNYGPSSIATISYRGGGANQTNVSWNGLPLNNPALGVTDFGLLNSFMIDDYIFTSQTSGLPNINGELKLESKIDTNLFTLSSILGSFGLRQNGLRFNKRFGRFQLGARLNRMVAENDFPYSIGSEKFITEHANYRQNALLLESEYAVSPKMNLNFSSWYSNTFRQIPKTTRQNQSEAVQEDRSLKNIVRVRYSNPSWSLNSYVGYTVEEIVYEDKQIDLKSSGEMNSWYTNTNIHKYFNRLTLGLNTTVNYATSSTAALRGRKDNINVSSGVSGRLDLNELWIHSGVTTAANLNNEVYFPWRLVFGYDLSQFFTTSVQLGQQIRFPTINDMYWNPGGDSTLSPERSDEIELSLKYNKNHFTLKLSGYYRDVDDWIMWAQDPNGPFFRVQNIARVITRGIELYSQHQLNVGPKFKLTNTINGTFNLSENQSAIQSPAIEKGAQLFYTPKYKFNLRTGLEFGACAITVDPMMVSNTIGINEQIDGYFILNASMDYTLTHKLASAVLRISAENITNTSYRIIEYRPMPGTNFKISLLFTLS